MNDTNMPARPLGQLIPLIRDEVKQGLDHYAQAGELLIEARAQIHEGWGYWLRKNFALSQRTAYDYMKAARSFKVLEDIEVRPRRTLSSATSPRRSTDHTPQWEKEVRQQVKREEMERFRKEAESQRKEEALIKALGIKLIDVGYKVLAAKLHPDKGGSVEAMARLNRVRKLLKEAL